jgi:glucosamine-6-phosphate deaminase
MPPQDGAIGRAVELVQRSLVRIGTILEARSILLLATGAAKVQATVSAPEGPVTTGCPASAPRPHGDVTILCDREAASLPAKPGRQNRWKTI